MNDMKDLESIKRGSIKICGTGSALPAKEVTNFDLEKMMDTSDEWIRERTGIGARRVAEDETVSSLAAQACKNALEMAGKNPEDVDLILVATCSPEMLLPCCACQVQDIIGADNAVCFDINAACSGFLFGLDTAYAYINSGLYKNALVVGSEVLSRIVNWEDRTTCVLFGDGAGAVYVEKTVEENEGIIGMVQGSNGKKGMVLSCNQRTTNPEEDIYVHMDGQAVYKFATRQVPACIEEVLEKTGLHADDIDLYILHQANKRILESIAKHLKVSMDKFPMNLNRVGNMSSAAIPVLLDEQNRAGNLKKGQTLVLSGFGAGLTYGACVMKW